MMRVWPTWFENLNNLLIHQYFKMHINNLENTRPNFDLETSVFSKRPFIA